jgi:hypothetical protein
LFITDSRLEAIDGFFEDDLYEMQNWDDEQYQAIVAYTNYLNDNAVQGCQIITFPPKH